MSTIKKISFFLFLILFLLSMVHDLSKPISNNQETDSEQIKNNLQIAHIKITPGETVLSITEKINEMENLDVEKIIIDFQTLNPGTDYKALIPNSFYYFPLYSESD